MDKQVQVVSSQHIVTQRLLAEGAKPLLVAAREAGLNPAPTVKTLLRWTIAGTNGKKLERVRVGGRVLTSVAAVQRFILGQVRVGQPSPADAAMDHESALKVLDRLGVRVPDIRGEVTRG